MATRVYLLENGSLLMGLYTDPRELLHSMMKIQNMAAKVGGNIFYPHDPAEFKSYRNSPEFYEG